ncbi:FAD dependent oxidoreductase [Russula earlei]|uniref:FAD dependent oxidoreductase n=1 Tax=Russula earlei TaxID=71964 RepID=A0ACC0UME6_9AGAM|nr:FAD dependent oxidoreductase [Russula earlei]
MAAPAVQNVIVVGAGIIGVATAHHLSRLSPALTIHLLDSSPSLFASASGQAAGFLARDWFRRATASLGALSFDLHRQLAEEHDGARRWGYSPSTAFSLPEARTPPNGKKGEDWLLEGRSRSTSATVADADRDGPTPVLPRWLAAGRDDTAHSPAEPVSSWSTTAQVNPSELCQFLLDQCRSRNVHVHHPVTATGLVSSPPGDAITGLSVRSRDGSERVMPCDALVLTAGVWTPRVFSTLFPNATVSLPISHLSGHSVVLRSPHWKATEPPAHSTTTGCHAIFTTDSDADCSPEIFSRLGGDIYLAGLNTMAIPVPELASEVQPEPASIEVLIRIARKLLGEDQLVVLRTGFCHRPVFNGAAPLLTTLTPDQTGVNLHGGIWVSAGHGPWGISLSLGTGLVLAELVLRKDPSADVSRLGLCT